MVKTIFTIYIIYIKNLFCLILPQFDSCNFGFFTFQVFLYGYWLLDFFQDFVIITDDKIG